MTNFRIFDNFPLVPDNWSSTIITKTMKKDDFLYNILDLDRSEATIQDIEPSEFWYHVTIAGRKQWVKCPMCNKYTKKRQDKRIATTKPFKHLVVSNDLCIDLIIKKRYCRCVDCWISFMEQLYCEAKKWFHTPTFERYVIDCWWYMSGNQIARNAHCSPRVPWHILQGINAKTLNLQWVEIMKNLDEIWLWVDEHSFKWRDMILVLTDIKAKKVLWVLENTRKATLQLWYDELPEEIKNKMKWITSDMAQWYQSAILERAPHLLTSIDKYHLVQEANRMVDQVRMIEIWLAKSKFFNKSDWLRKWNISKKQAEKLLLEEKK